MELEELIKEFNQHVSKVEKVYANFKKVSKNRKTPAYKLRRLTEAAKIWDDLAQCIVEIDIHYEENPDECFNSAKDKVTKTYNEYLGDLQKLKGNSTIVTGTGNPNGPETITEGGSEDDRSMDGEIVAFLQKQNVRHEALKRALEDVKQKSLIEQNMTMAYCKIKSKLVTESWTRIQVADEECECDRAELPDDYMNQMEELEISVEETLLALQEGMERPKAGGSDLIKLPRATIPKFGGDYFKWMSFRDLFGTLVLKNESLSDGQRMQMLKTNVTGEAESLISDLSITDVNFDCAWKRLLDRYDNKRVVVYKHLNKLMTQQLTKTESKSVKKLLDTTDQILLALKNLGRPTEHWDDWIIVIITQKLSDECRKDWERRVGNSNELTKWDQIKQFLEEEFRMLEGVEHNHKKGTGDKNEPQQKSSFNSHQVSLERTNCPACEEDHSLFACEKFKSMEVNQRWDLAKRKKLCFSCLHIHKEKLKCDKKKPCKKCKKPHSTWLHERSVKENQLVVGHCAMPNIPKEVLLATAIISVSNIYGQTIELRALIDSGSQGSLITERAAAMLQLKKNVSSRNVVGIGASNTGPVKSVTVKVFPRFKPSMAFNIQCYILKKLTRMLPETNLCTKNWNHIKGLQWADPKFYKTGKIDVLLGMDVIVDIMIPGLIKGPVGQPMAQNTQFGWIISGKIDPSYPTSDIKCFMTSNKDDPDDLSRFWEIEELNPKRTLTNDEHECEEFYKSTVTRDEKGMYVVRVPFKEGMVERLGSSKNQSLSRFFQLEKRFATNQTLKVDYTKVMEEYLSLGHMIDVTDLPSDKKLYYIPHHAVIKPDSLTTKTRVVFDASAKTTTGISLNECMYTGAKQQHDLLDILIKWRKHKFVFKADVEKMYRQVKLTKDDQRFHTVIWRDDSSKPWKEYQLTTATFGTAAAPFMATRTLNKTASDNAEKFPLAIEAIQQDCYVDDLISGGNSIKEIKQLTKQIISSLQEGHMTLRKWTSNCPELLETLPEELTERSLQVFAEDDTTKALGLQWNPTSDEFSFMINWSTDRKKLTKRQLLAEASKLFDPLGWLAPIIISAKILMQQVWLSKIGWDDEIPSNMKDIWETFRDQLPKVGDIKISRWLQSNNYSDTNEHISIHCFCDASETAYAAVVYTRVERQGQVFINLVASKTRVAPVKTKQTLPRLELCGAVLGAALTNRVREVLNLTSAETYAWSDSRITLGWIHSDAHRWKTFVANRIVDIHSQKMTHWEYVKSEENPADCASRGLMPNELENHALWWNGPPWLKKNKASWTKTQIDEPEIERRSIKVNAAVLTSNSIFERFSSWTRLVRFTAYALRFKTKLKGSLTAEELETAKTSLIRKAQTESFPQELAKLKANVPVSKKGKLLQLHPFIDGKGIIRVGGRLAKAKISYENKHPVILARNHPVSKLIMKHIHEDTMHGGPEMMMNLLKKEFWVINGKKLASELYAKCVICRRYRGKTNQQIMGELPTARVTLERTFGHTGLDYTGPVEIKSSKLRNARIQKGYIAVYICMATKAVHLELVSDTSTDAFLASFERFVARRRLVTTMYSDNGTNFVGGANKLERNWFRVKNTELSQLVANRGVSWKFIPPNAANFGGLWERAVGLTKHHLKRTLQTAKLTFEEYSTVLCNIEACLNSRPLCPVSNDPESMEVLTPGHFLIGTALKAPPAPTLLDNTSNNVKRWNYLQLLQQHFWNRWNDEYLSQMQKRQKWNHPNFNLQVNDMVVLKDEDLPPRDWLMGRIEEVYPGTDGRVRVATVRIKTDKMQGEHNLPKTTLLKRPANKLCPLLLEEERRADHTLDDDQSEDSTDDQRSNPVKQVPTSTGHRHPLRSRKTTLATVLVTILMAILLVGGGSASDNDFVRVSKFDHNAGIYFENLGRANVIRSTWHMYVKFDLKRYFTDYDRMWKITHQLTALCAEIEAGRSRDYCEETTTLLNHQMDEISEFNTLFRSQERNQKSLKLRKRRTAPLAIGGWVQHELFGVMASDQAEQIEQHFDMVEQNSDQLLQLIKNQTSIVEGTVNLMKNSQEEINRNYEKIESSIQQLRLETNYVEIRLRILALSISTLAMVNRIDSIQENILDMLTELHQGHVSTHVFTPEQFKEQLELINNNLPAGVMIPEIEQHDIQLLYKVIKGSARVTNESVILDIIIPLVSTTHLQVLHVITFPIEYQGQHLSIVPDADYLMITLKKDYFYQVTSEELHTCMKPQENTFICSLRNPMHNTISPMSRCEREMLEQTEKINQDCRFNITKERNFWIRLAKENKWIYGVNETTTLNVICGKQAKAVALDGSGIVEIAPGCEATQLGMTIIAESVKSSTGNFSYYPMLNLSNAVLEAEKRTSLKMMNLTLNHSEQMTSLNKQISELNKQSKLNHIHHISHYGGQIGTVLIMTLLVLIAWCTRNWIKTAITRWMNPNDTEAALDNDVEHGSYRVQQNSNGDDQEIHHGSVDRGMLTSSTIDQHKGGRCPFRT